MGPLGLSGSLFLGLLVLDFLLPCDANRDIYLVGGGWWQVGVFRVGPLVLSGSLSLGLLFEFFRPYEPWPLFRGR